MARLRLWIRDVVLPLLKDSSQHPPTTPRSKTPISKRDISSPVPVPTPFHKPTILIVPEKVSPQPYPQASVSLPNLASPSASPTLSSTSAAASEPTTTSKPSHKPINRKQISGPIPILVPVPHSKDTTESFNLRMNKPDAYARADITDPPLISGPTPQRTRSTTFSASPSAGSTYASRSTPPQHSQSLSQGRGRGNGHGSGIRNGEAMRSGPTRSATLNAHSTTAYSNAPFLARKPVGGAAVATATSTSSPLPSTAPLTAGPTPSGTLTTTQSPSTTTDAASISHPPPSALRIAGPVRPSGAPRPLNPVKRALPVRSATVSAHPQGQAQAQPQPQLQRHPTTITHTTAPTPTATKPTLNPKSFSRPPLRLQLQLKPQTQTAPVLRANSHVSPPDAQKPLMQMPVILYEEEIRYQERVDGGRAEVVSVRKESGVRYEVRPGNVAKDGGERLNAGDVKVMRRRSKSLVPVRCQDGR